MNKPEMKVNAGIYYYEWPELNVAGMVQRIHSNHETISGEITIVTKNPGVEETLEHTRLNLLSSQSRNQLAKALSERDDTQDWVNVIKYICILTLNDYRRGELTMGLGDKPEVMSADFLLWPILKSEEATTIFGPGGSGKSYLADYIAVLIQYGGFCSGIYGWTPKPANVLYLDWEASYHIHQKRVWAIKQGLGIDSPDKIQYRFCSQPLSDDINEIQRLTLENDTGLIIVDSQVAACGDDPEKAESANRFYNALRSLKCASLVIDHVPKNTEAGKPMPFGSVFKWNRARSIFEIRQTQEPGENTLEIGLYHRKSNESRLIRPIGIRLEFGYKSEDSEELESLTVSETDIKEIPELAKGLSQKQRIINTLKGAGKLTIEDIVEELPEISKANIKTILSQNKDIFINLDGHSWGLITNES